MAIERVAKRVSEGGHIIPTDVIYRRYWAGLQNFFIIFAPIVDSWMFYNNMDTAVLLADEENIYDNLFLKVKESCLNRKNTEFSLSL